MPFLINNLKNNEFLLDLLIDRCINDFKSISNLYWCIKVYCIDNDNKFITKIVIAIKTRADNDQRFRFRDMIDMDVIDCENDIQKLIYLNKKKELLFQYVRILISLQSMSKKL